MQRSAIPVVETKFNLKTRRNNAPSELTRDYREEILLLKLTDLKPYRYQARKTFNEEEIRTLADTIKKYGIKNPLTVCFDAEDDKYEIISGERRFRAAVLLQLDKVPCRIERNRAAAQEIALIENIQRKDLHPVELLDGIEHCIKADPDVSKDDLIKRLGLSKSYFYKLLKLSVLTQEVRNIVITQGISGEALYNLANVPPREQLEALQVTKPTTKAISSLDKAMTKKCRVLQLSIKNQKMEIETNLAILTNARKAEAILMLQNLIGQLEDDLNKLMK